MSHFYRTQTTRLTSLGQENIKFQDVLCQMIDMISPNDTSSITIKDLILPEKRKASGIIFDLLFNLNKFLRFEMRDPFQEKLKREDGFNNDWDRFAHYEYHRLAAEEEGSNQANNSVDQANQLDYYNNYDNQNQSNYNQQGNQQSIGHHDNDSDDSDNDDYHMFAEDDNDNDRDNISNIHNNMMDVDNNLDPSNTIRGSTNNNNNRKNINDLGDWSLDDESDDEDDYQVVGNKNKSVINKTRK